MLSFLASPLASNSRLDTPLQRQRGHSFSVVQPWQGSFAIKRPEK
jgi:hypothetical protein